MKSGDQFVSLSRHDLPNSHSYHPGSAESFFSPQDDGAFDNFRSGFDHEVEDIVKLELTAEQMLGDEVLLAREYVKEDSGNFWRDIKEGFINWELATGQMLLSAADPTRVEWQEHHWWGDDEAQFH